MEQFNTPGNEGWLEIIILTTLIYTLFRFLKEPAVPLFSQVFLFY